VQTWPGSGKPGRFCCTECSLVYRVLRTRLGPVWRVVTGGVQEVPDLPTCFEQVAKSCKFMLNLDNFGQFGDDFEVQNRFG